MRHHRLDWIPTFRNPTIARPLRVALYARYSSEHQRDASIEDQLRLCRERAAREGWHIVDNYSDRSV